MSEQQQTSNNDKPRALMTDELKVQQSINSEAPALAKLRAELAAKSKVVSELQDKLKDTRADYHARLATERNAAKKAEKQAEALRQQYEAEKKAREQAESQVKELNGKLAIFEAARPVIEVKTLRHKVAEGVGEHEVLAGLLADGWEIINTSAVLSALPGGGVVEQIITLKRVNAPQPEELARVELPASRETLDFVLSARGSENVRRQMIGVLQRIQGAARSGGATFPTLQDGNTITLEAN